MVVVVGGGSSGSCEFGGEAKQGKAEGTGYAGFKGSGDGDARV